MKTRRILTTGIFKTNTHTPTRTGNYNVWNWELMEWIPEAVKKRLVKETGVTS